MYWNPFDLAHSGQIDGLGGWAIILGFILGQSLVGCGVYFLNRLLRHLLAKDNTRWWGKT
jgi:hypothetical protein